MATQAQRRESTRAAVVQAAVESLVEGGVSGFTAADVAVRAAVSNGSVFRYFPTLTDLLAATVESVFAGLSQEYVMRYAALSSPVVTPRLLLALLWDVFNDPAVAAVYEVYAAARTDPKLRSAIEPMIREHVDVIDQLGRRILA